MQSPEDPWLSSLDSSTIHGGEAAPSIVPRPLPALTVIAHPDPERVGERTLLPELVSGRTVELSRRSPSFAHPGAPGPARPLADPGISRKALVLGGGGDPETLEVSLHRGAHSGAVRVDGEPFADRLDFVADPLLRGVVIELAGRVALLLHAVGSPRPPTAPEAGLVGESDGILRLRAELARVAGLEVPVLLRGESGSGKELAARALHDGGPRRGRPFVALNMAALPANLAAAELFGAEKGAFTGADRRRPGAFRRAEGGTLFLDEIGTASVEVQDLLLRAVETREIRPVGGDTAQRLDVRLVTATDADLDRAVEEGRFRLPLLHRLGGWVVRLPPLRERRDDVARLLLHFLRAELAALDAAQLLADPGPGGRPWLPAPLLARLVAHDWPGNVRELRNVARRLAVGGHDRQQALLADDLERELGTGSRAGSSSPSSSVPSSLVPGPPPAAEPVTAEPVTAEPAAATPARRTYRSPSEVVEEELIATLRAHRFRLGPTAEALGISRASLYVLVDDCPRVRKAADLGREELERVLAEVGGDVDGAADRLEVSAHGLRLRLRELGLGKSDPGSD